MFFGSPLSRVGDRGRRCKPFLRTFITSQRGAVTVDFLPLLFAVIGLGVAVVSFIGASLSTPTTQVSSMLESVTVGDYKLGLGGANADRSAAGLPKITDTPPVTPPAAAPEETDPGSASANGTGQPVRGASGSGGSSGGVSTATVGLIGVVSVGAGSGGSQTIPDRDGENESDESLFGNEDSPLDAADSDAEASNEVRDLFTDTNASAI